MIWPIISKHEHDLTNNIQAWAMDLLSVHARCHCPQVHSLISTCNIKWWDCILFICGSHYDIVTYQNSKFDQSLIRENKDIGYACNRHLCEWMHIMCTASIRLFFSWYPFSWRKSKGWQKIHILYDWFSAELSSFSHINNNCSKSMALLATMHRFGKKTNMVFLLGRSCLGL